jgi:hypothetical protein
MLRNRSGVFSQARVEGRLSAAGLLAGEIHTDAEAAENVHDGLTSLREERIDKAGDEELDCGHKSILPLVTQITKFWFGSLRDICNTK